MNYSLIIPIYNEETTLEELLIQLNKLNNNIEIIIVNDGSTDKTESILKNQGLFKVINHLKNEGKGSSISSGIAHATNNTIILMDGDLEIDMHCISKAIKAHAVKSNHIIIGSRWSSKNESEHSLNNYGNYFINYIFNALYKTDIKDVLCCVKVFNRDLFESLKIKSLGFNIEMEIMSKLCLGGSIFHEIDVIYKRRKSNQGKKLKISDGWGILWTMLKIRFLK